MWKEEDHHRDNIGRFTKGGAKEYRQNTPYEEITKEKQDIRKGKSKDEFFGVEYTGFKAREAVDKLLQEKQGHVKAAFYRKEVGDIDLVWGDENGGLAHVIKRRDEMKAKGTGTISGLEMVKKIPDIIENGEFDIDKHDRIGLIFQSYRVAIRPTYDGLRLNWIVSAMEIKNNP